MRLPKTAHTSRPWRIHEVAPDFELEDVWALPTAGGPDELPRLVSQAVSGDFPEGAPLIVRVLWEARWQMGATAGVGRTGDRPRHPMTSANRSVHSIMHIGRVADEQGGYGGQMAVLVKPNGWFGAAYMAAIKPFRDLFVYPALLREVGRDWRASSELGTEAAA
jgi:hypothetical protein